MSSETCCAISFRRCKSWSLSDRFLKVCCLPIDFRSFFAEWTSPPIPKQDLTLILSCHQHRTLRKKEKDRSENNQKTSALFSYKSLHDLISRDSNSCEVTFPMPLTLRIGRLRTNDMIFSLKWLTDSKVTYRSGSNLKYPSGLFKSAHTFARRLFGAMPIEHVSFVRSRIFALISFTTSSQLLSCFFK